MAATSLRMYVSTGGFTKDAHYEAERSNVALTLITLPRLRELLLERYEQLHDVLNFALCSNVIDVQPKDRCGVCLRYEGP